MNSLTSNGAIQGLNHLPALLTIAAFGAVWLLLWLPLAAATLLVTRQKLRFPVPSEQKIPLLISLYVLAPALLGFYAHRLAGETLATYGWVWQPSLAIGLLAGVGLGVGGVGLLSGIQIAANWSTIQPRQSSWLAIAGTTAAIGGLTLFISAVEELVFRGFVVNQLQIGYSWPGVVLISAAIFALLHLVWDGPAGIPQLPGLVLMGAVLLAARWANDGLLGLPSGLHWGWIWSLAVLDTTGMIAPHLEAPRWIVGLPGQPLTSPLVLLLLGATGLLVWWLG